MSRYLISFAVLFLPSCVSFPIPPVGDDAGRYGYVDIKVQYRPNLDVMWSAFRSREEPKPTSSK